MSSTLADQLVEVLRQAGVQRVCGVVGDSLNPVVDAIRRADGVEWVHVRNEEAGAFAAAAEAQLTRRLAMSSGVRGASTTYLTGTLTRAVRIMVTEPHRADAIAGNAVRLVALLCGAVIGAVLLRVAPLLAPALPAVLVGTVVVIAAASARGTKEES